jgi:Fic family protein
MLKKNDFFNIYPPRACTILLMNPFDRNQLHNNLPDLPPNTELETKAVLKQAIGANRALAELKGVGELIPNPSVLVRLIGLQEAKLSSEIENIVTTNDELYRAFSDTLGRFDPATKEVLHYNDALWYGYEHLRQGRPLTTNLFEEITSIVKETQMRVRSKPGTKIGNSGSGEIIYTPPEGEQVIRDKLHNLEQFIYDDQDGLDPLVKLAVLHYQFEAIHPFSDGNGRAGRILNILYLIEHKLLEWPVLYLSGYIMQHRNGYYDGLRRVTEDNDWEQWVLYILRAIELTATETNRRISSIRNLMQTTADLVREKLPRTYSKDLIEAIFQQPYCRISGLEKTLGITRQTASTRLKQLEGLGVLESVKVGTEVYFIHRAFLNALTQKLESTL